MATHADGMPDMVRVGDERTVEQVVLARLRRSILDGTLAPGARLRYRQLAEQFGVSVTPVRVALKELAGEGLVELRPHAGASVSALSVEELEEVLLTRTSLEPFLEHSNKSWNDGYMNVGQGAFNVDAGGLRLTA
jgi:DNA-binding GntR family transcriptional regulator